MPSLRCTQKTDLEQINLILSKSFTHARQKEGAARSRVPLCRPEFLQMYLAANPGGSFVLEKEHRIIAYCFSRLWGKVGWIGPLSVLPAEQGQGLGKRIVLAAVEHLIGQGATTIGLELAAESNKNLAFYTRLGFIPQMLTVDLIRDVPQCTETVPSEWELSRYTATTAEGRVRFLRAAQALATDVQPGLDYRTEMDLTEKFRFGDALLVERSGRALAFVLAHTETYSQEEERLFLKVNALQLAPREDMRTLDALIRLVSNWASEVGLRGIYLRAYTRYFAAYKWLLSKGFRAVHNELRMTLDGYDQLDDPTAVNFNKWE